MVIYPFNTPMKTLNFLFLCLIFTTNASSIAKTPIGSTKKFCFVNLWTVFIYNSMNDPLTVHVKSGNDDLGEHTLAVSENTNWQFCENFWMTTMFWADFNSNGTRPASFHMWDHEWGLNYGSGSFINAERRLAWLVREDGFYVGIPKGWEKRHDWS